MGYVLRIVETAAPDAVIDVVVVVVVISLDSFCPMKIQRDKTQSQAVPIEHLRSEGCR